MIGREFGVAGFLHPEGIYDDPKGGAFRREVYSRLRSHFQFANEKKLFNEVDHHTSFSVNIYGRQSSEAKFDHLANLYAPATVDATFVHDGSGIVPGLKDDGGQWNTNGHRSRALEVDSAALGMFAALYDEGGTLPRPFFVLLALFASWAAGTMVWSAKHASGRQDPLRAVSASGRGRVLV